MSFVFLYTSFIVDKNNRGITASFREYIKFNLILPLFNALILFGSYVLYKMITNISIWSILAVNIVLIALYFVLISNPISIRKYKDLKSRENDPSIITHDIITMFIQNKFTPHIKIINTDKLKIANAAQSKNAYIYLYSYLIDNLNHNELKAIIAHELGHAVMHHNIKGVTTIFVVLIFSLNLILYPILCRKFYLILIIGFIVLYVTIFVITPIQQRHYEIKADLFAAKLAGANNVITALEKTDKLNDTPSKFSIFLNLSHPSTKRRINIIERAGK